MSIKRMNPVAFVFWATVICVALGVLNQIFNQGRQAGINSITFLYILLLCYGLFLSFKSINMASSKIVVAYSVAVFVLAAVGIYKDFSSRAEQSRDVEQLKELEREVFQERVRE